MISRVPGLEADSERPCPVRTVLAVMEAVPAPRVVRLPGRCCVHQHCPALAGCRTDDQRHIALVAVVRFQSEQVRTLRQSFHPKQLRGPDLVSTIDRPVVQPAEPQGSAERGEEYSPRPSTQRAWRAIRLAWPQRPTCSSRTAPPRRMRPGRACLFLLSLCTCPPKACSAEGDTCRLSGNGTSPPSIPFCSQGSG